MQYEYEYQLTHQHCTSITRRAYTHAIQFNIYQSRPPLGFQPTQPLALPAARLRVPLPAAPPPPPPSCPPPHRWAGAADSASCGQTSLTASLVSAASVRPSGGAVRNPPPTSCGAATTTIASPPSASAEEGGELSEWMWSTIWLKTPEVPVEGGRGGGMRGV